MRKHRRLTLIRWIAVAVLQFPLVNANAASAHKDSQIHCLALTLYWESRADGKEAMEAVGWVVLNRRNDPEFPETICAVVREGGETPPCQFSYWCDGLPDTPQKSDAWQLAKNVAAQMLSDPPPDPTHGALFYHSTDIAPPWTRRRKLTARIDHHVFYR